MALGLPRGRRSDRPMRTAAGTPGPGRAQRVLRAHGELGTRTSTLTPNDLAPYGAMTPVPHTAAMRHGMADTRLFHQGDHGRGYGFNPPYPCVAGDVAHRKSCGGTGRAFRTAISTTPDGRSRPSPLRSAHGTCGSGKSS